MYGVEYLDWRDHEHAAGLLDGFQASLPAHNRKWVLAVLRERFEVRVEYRDSPLVALSRAASDQYARRQACGQPHLGHVGASGSVLTSILGGL